MARQSRGDRSHCKPTFLRNASSQTKQQYTPEQGFYKVKCLHGKYVIPLTVFLSNAPNGSRLNNIYKDRKSQEMDIMLYTVFVFLSVIPSSQPGRVHFCHKTHFCRKLSFLLRSHGKGFICNEFHVSNWKCIDTSRSSFFSF